MKITLLILIYSIFSIYKDLSQQNLVIGLVLDADTLKPLASVKISIENSSYYTLTNENGTFQLKLGDIIGEQILKLEKQDYIQRRFPIEIMIGEILDLGELTLNYNQSNESDLFVVALTDQQILEEDDAYAENISGLLQSSKDVFLKAAAYDFSAAFYKPKGLSSKYSKVLINGMEMNKLTNGRPLWANWGGLNDAQRNQDYRHGFSPNDYSFGGLGGTTNITMRASRNRKGGRVSMSTANKSYNSRLMLSYHSGLLKSGWSYSLLGSLRYADEGYVDGTSYKSNAIYGSVEKQLNHQQSLNFSLIYSMNKRGRSSPITKEVYDIKGKRYNPNWGMLNGEPRNSKIREIVEPIVMFNHYWEAKPSLSINTSALYQFGKIANSRIDNGGTRLVEFEGQESYIGGGTNPDPSYYQKLPSYFLRTFPTAPSPHNYEQAYLAEQKLINDGQLNWQDLYNANYNLASQGHPAAYALQEDRNDGSLFSINSIINYSLNEKQTFEASLSLRNLKSNNYGRIKDLLGGTEFLDVDFFAEENEESTSGLSTIAQSDLQNRNRLVKEGEVYKYNYELNSSALELFAQTQGSFKKIDYHVGLRLSNRNFFRTGLMENGNYPGSESFGKSKKVNAFDYGIKLGANYNFSGKHIFGVNAVFASIPPVLNEVFSNPRQNNRLVQPINSEKIIGGELNYYYRSNKFNSRITAYQLDIQDGTDIGFYFTEDLAGLGLDKGNAFVQEITTGINQRHLGLELGLEYQLSSSLKLKGAAAVSQNYYTNNPDLYLTSDDFKGQLSFGNGATILKNLHLANGPENVFHLGFDYRDPDYWWFGASVNYISNAYINVSKLARSSNFNLDFDGQPIVEYNPDIAKNLLQQEQFPSFYLANVIGGKSWRIKNYYIGFFAVVNNLLNKEFISGGYEQSRLANYTLLKNDRIDNPMPVFGSRYYYGNGTTYFINVYFSF